MLHGETLKSLAWPINKWGFAITIMAQTADPCLKGAIKAQAAQKERLANATKTVLTDKKNEA